MKLTKIMIKMKKVVTKINKTNQKLKIPIFNNKINNKIKIF